MPAVHQQGDAKEGGMIDGNIDAERRTVAEIDAQIAALATSVADIDTQFAFYKAGEFPEKSAGWRARALFAKTRMQGQISQLKLDRRAMVEVEANEKKLSEEAAKQERIRLDRERKEEVAESWKKKFRALQDWVWLNFPDSREALIAETKRIKND